MKQVRLKGSSISTSQVGFGCAGLTSLSGRRDCLRILECAYDYGVRHFDVARLYGAGTAEGILGEFARGRRDTVTMATKFGLNPPSLPNGLGRHVQTIKKMLKQLPALDRLVRRKVHERSTGGNFGLEAARSCLETSLRELRTDYLDIWLLHEATATDANNSDLLEFLIEQQKRGVIRTFGIGSDINKIVTAENGFAEAHNVLQFENSIVNPNLAKLSNMVRRTFITHGAMKHFFSLRERLQFRPDLRSRFYDETGVELGRAENLAGLLLAWAIHDNPNGVVLFNSSSTKNIKNNIVTTDDNRFGAEVTSRFSQLLCETQIKGPQPYD